MNIAKLSVASLGLSLAFSAAQAALVTSSAGFVSPTVVDFNAFAGGGYGFTYGPVAVGAGVTFTATGPNNSGLGAVLGEGGYGLGSNGMWDTGTTAPGAYTGVDGDGTTSSMTYTLSSPVAAIGGFMNYVPGYSGFPLIEALDSGSNVLESYDLELLAPISTPGGFNDGAFRGIVRPSADIYAFRVVSAYAVLDDLTFAGGVIPEPAETAVAGATLAGLGAILLRRRNKKA
jgi:hypothetical protein